MTIFGKKKKDDEGDESRPSEKELLEARFGKIILALGLPTETREDMLKWDDERKKQLIKQHKEQAQRKDVKAKKVDPQIYVTSLRNISESTLMTAEEMRTHMAKLRHYLTSSLMGWVAKFLHLGGFQALLEVFKRALSEEKIITLCIVEGILIMKALMNTPPGLKAVVETQETYKYITTSIAKCGISTDVGAKDLTIARQISQGGMDILTSVGLVPPDGHRLVLEASNSLDNNPRFYWLLQELFAGTNSLPDSAGVLVSGMSLINVIVNSPDEMRARVVLRNELFAMGLDALLELLEEASDSNEKLANQLSTFTFLHEDDMFELETRFETIARDPVDLVRQLIRKLQRTPVYTSLMSVLHNLATVSAGRMTPSKVNCWRHVETSINRIILHDIGSTMDVDLAHLQSILNKSEFGDSVPLPWTEVSHTKSNKDGGWRKVEMFTRGSKMNSAYDISSSDSTGASPSGSRRGGGSGNGGSGIGGIAPAKKTVFVTASRPPSARALRDISSSHRSHRSSPLSSLSPSPAPPPPTEDTPPENSPSSPSAPLPLSSPSPSDPTEIAPPPPAEHKVSPPVRRTTLLANVPPPPPLPKKMIVQPQGKMLKPTLKTKTLQWKKVPERQAVSSPFWSKAVQVDLEVNQGLLESLFAVKEVRLSKALIGGTSENRVSASPGVPAAGPKLTLIDAKRANNIEIMLSSRLKKAPNVLAEAVLSMDDSVIDSEGVAQMMKWLPTTDEERRLQSLSMEDIPRLGKAEQYMFEMMKIPRAANKLECWEFIRNFHSTVEETAPLLSLIKTASEQVGNSKRFAYLLQVVLALGNFLNFGGGQGNALGFKLDGLTKLREVKAADNKTSLLNVLADLVEVRNPDALDFYDEIPGVEEARKINLQILKAKIKDLRAGITMCQGELAAEIAPGEDIFRSKVAAFLEVAAPKLNSLDAILNATENSYNNVLTHFGEDATTNSEEFFELLARFATMLAAAQADNESRRRREAYQAKRLERERARSRSRPQAAEKIKEVAAGEGGGFDNILTEIQSKRRPTIASGATAPRLA